MASGYQVGQHRLAPPFPLRPLAFCPLSLPRTILQIFTRQELPLLPFLSSPDLPIFAPPALFPPE